MPSKNTTSKRNQLGDLLKRAGAESSRTAARRAPSEPAPLVVKSIALTPAALEVLDRLTREVPRAHRRTTSASAIVRALLRYAEQQGAFKVLGSLIEAEIASGEVVWGRARSR
jgi:hypothetical protein